MAKKPKEVSNKKGRVNKDEDFNSDIDEIQSDIDGEFNMDFGGGDESFDKPSKLQLGKDFVKSTSSEFLQSAIKRSSEKLLPEEYRFAYSELSDTFDSVKYEVSTGLEELKKSSIPTLRLINRVLPKRIKYLDTLIERYTGEPSKSKQQEQEENISSTLTGIFEKQIAQEKIENAQQEARDSAKISISKLNQESLNSIDNSVSTLTSFNLSIAKEYYRKSLEFQLRSFFTQREHLEEFKKYSTATVRQFDEIIKNTKLADIVKLANTDNIDQILRSKAYRTVYAGTINKEDYMTTVKKRVVGAVKEKMANALDKMTGISNAAESLSSLSESMGMSPIVGIAGGIIGSTIGEKLIKNIEPEKAEKIKESATVSAGKNTIKGFLNSPGMFIDSIQKKLEDKKYQSMGEGGLFGSIKEKLYSVAGEGVNLLRPVKPNMKLEEESVIDYTAPAIFDVRTKRSITDVIPLYLAKILKENTLIRSYYQQVNSDKIKPINVEELHFDPIKRTLVGKEEKIASITSSILKSKISSKVSNTTRNFTVGIDGQSKFKKQLDKGDTSGMFNIYLKEAKNKGYNPTTIKELVELTDKDLKLKEIAKSSTSLTKLFDEYKKASESEKKYIDSVFNKAARDSSEDYPTRAVEDLLKFLLDKGGYDSKRIKYSDEKLLTIAKALAHYYYNRNQEDITAQTLASGKAFYFIEKENYPKVKDIISFIAKGVQAINEYGSYKDKAALNALISEINKLILDKQDTPLEAYKIIREFEPSINKLTATNIFESDFSKKQTVYEEPDIIATDIYNKVQTTPFNFTPTSNNIKTDLNDLFKTTKEALSSAFTKTKTEVSDSLTKAQEVAKQYYDDAFKKSQDIYTVFTELYKQASENSDSEIDRVATVAKAAFNIASDRVDGMIKDYQEKLNAEISGIMNSDTMSSEEKSELSKQIKENTELAIKKMQDFKKAIQTASSELAQKVSGNESVDSAKSYILNTLKELRNKIDIITKADKEHGQE